MIPNTTLPPYSGKTERDILAGILLANGGDPADIPNTLQCVEWGYGKYTARDILAGIYLAVSNPAPSIDLSSPPPIGDVAPNTGAFTSLVASAFQGVIGDITPAAGTFTRLIANSGTLVASAPHEFRQTWNDGAVNFEGIKIAITDTASNSNSLPLIITGGASGTDNLFRFFKSGNLSIAGNLTASWAIGTSFLSCASDTGGVLFGAAHDARILRVAAATLQMGATHATTPTAQRFQAHGVTLGTGAALTLAGGSGSLGSGSVIIPATWNAGATTFRGVDIIITDTASAAGSTPFRVLGGAAGTTRLLELDKNGKLRFVTGGSISTPVGHAGMVIEAEAAGWPLDLVAPVASINIVDAFGLTPYLGFSLTKGNTNPDLVISRAAAASLQLGKTHATTPTAQRLQAHGVTLGTGADLTLGGGSGTVAIGNVILDGGNRAAYDAAPSTTVIRDILISHGLMAAA